MADEATRTRDEAGGASGLPTATRFGGGDSPDGAEDANGAGAGEPTAAIESVLDDYAEKPHLYVAGAFVGGFLFARILKRFGG